MPGHTELFLKTLLRVPLSIRRSLSPSRQVLAKIVVSGCIPFSNGSSRPPPNGGNDARRLIKNAMSQSAKLT
jgi:hypothetical protein